MNRLGGDGSGIVTTGMVREEMTRRLRSEMVERRRFLPGNTRRARRHGFGTAEKEARAVTRITLACSVASSTPGRSGPRARSGTGSQAVEGPTRFEVAYNRKRVAAFTRKVLAQVVPAWGGLRGAMPRREEWSAARTAASHLETFGRGGR